MADDYSEFTKVTPEHYGSGRGSVNPPLIGQPQPPQNVYMPTRKPTTGYETLPPAAKSFQASVEGAARGATAGTFDYVPAGLAYLADRIRNIGKVNQEGNPIKPLTFDETLAATRARTAQVQSENPNAYLAGDVGGSVALGYATGGSSVPLTMLSQGTQSAVRKYAESPETTALDAAKAGGASATITAALGGVGKGVNMLTEAAKNRLVRQIAGETGVSLQEAERMIVSNLRNAEDPLQATTGDVIRAELRKIGELAWGGARTAAGTVIGGWAGGQAAPLFGVDKSTGQIIGAELGGGSQMYRAYKEGLAKTGLEGIANAAGFAHTAGYKRMGTDIANAVSSTAIPATQAILSPIKTEQSEDDYSAFKKVE
jgi:hypothetical protein